MISKILELILRKMYLSYNPEKTISRKGIIIRNYIYPLSMAGLRILDPYKLNIERKIEKPVGKPVMYMSTHSFKEDIVNAFLTVNGKGYVLFGPIRQFLRTFDGIKLLISGTVIVDRDDIKSRQASKKKMARVFSLGANMIVFPEGTWCISPNKLTENMHIGSYDILVSA